MNPDIRVISFLFNGQVYKFRIDINEAGSVEKALSQIVAIAQGPLLAENAKLRAEIASLKKQKAA